VEKSDRLVFENAGGLFEGSLDDYLFRDRIPRHYRNRLLAGAMVSLDMIDALGMGIKRMFLTQRNRYFPLPEYDFSQPDTVRMEIMGRLIDENYSRVLAGAVNRHRRYRHGATDLELRERVQDRVDAFSRCVCWDWEVVDNDAGGVELRAGGVLDELVEGGGHAEVGLRGVAADGTIPSAAASSSRTLFSN